MLAADHLIAGTPFREWACLTSQVGKGYAVTVACRRRQIGGPEAVQEDGPEGRAGGMPHGLPPLPRIPEVRCSSQHGDVTSFDELRPPFQPIAM